MTTDVEREIRARIAERGRVAFAEFMEAALYDPRGGYYTGAGADADYYTSPAAHPAFGALVAVQLSRMWEALGRPGCFTAVEMGSGSGLLASDVVSYARRALGPFAEALRYVTVDRARPARADGAVRHVVASRMPFAGVVGCVLSNELLDAFPVRRFEVRDGRVLEVYVVVRGGRFAEELGEPVDAGASGPRRPARRRAAGGLPGRAEHRHRAVDGRRVGGPGAWVRAHDRLRLRPRRGRSGRAWRHGAGLLPAHGRGVPVRARRRAGPDGPRRLLPRRRGGPPRGAEVC